MRVVIRKNPDGFRGPRTIAQALVLTPADMGGPVLRELAQLHRAQVKRMFFLQSSSSGRWAPLNPSYEKRKRKVSRRGILVLTGDMRSRFVEAENPSNVARYVPRGTGGVFQFGAYSNVAAAHLYGNPLLAAGNRSGPARKLFGGIAPRLPKRDMITKSPWQVRAFSMALNEWYRTKRIPQALRHFSSRGKR